MRSDDGQGGKSQWTCAGGRHKLVPPAAGNVNSAALARWFRKGYLQGFNRRPSGTYMGPIVKQLNGRVSLFKHMGRLGAWYVPALLGVYNVHEAPAGMKMRTLFQEGFGVVGGWIGTGFGVAVGLSIVSILALGPLGLFITVFLCSTAGGLIGYELFKGVTGKGYDASQYFGESIYHSFDELMGAFQ